jgi:hypothetical protein
MAIRGIPKDARVVGGKGVRLRPAELTKLAMRVRPRLSRRFDGPDILLSGLRFEQVNGVGITRLFLGRPFYRRTGTGAPIDSIQICEAFVDGDSLLATEEYSRVSGELERAETEPPELDVENWHEVQRQTIGFFRLERDKAWRHLTVDVGFEGINWMVVGLSPGMPIQQHYYLYTSH